MKSDISLSITVPTIGRPTLTRTLVSITSQMLPGDQLLVMKDDSGDWGMTPRNRALGIVNGDYLLWMDDDDIYFPNAFEIIRTALRENPNRPHLFRMKRGEPWNDLIPPDNCQDISAGLVSTQIFVTPNNLARLGRWGLRYEGDFDFCCSTLALYPEGSLVRRSEVIAYWRPGEEINAGG